MQPRLEMGSLSKQVKPGIGLNHGVLSRSSASPWLAVIRKAWSRAPPGAGRLHVQTVRADLHCRVELFRPCSISRRLARGRISIIGGFRFAPRIRE